MGVRLDKVKDEWQTFKKVWAEERAKGRKLHHQFQNFFVEKNRWMPYSWGHVEPWLYLLIIIVIVELW